MVIEGCPASSVRGATRHLLVWRSAHTLGIELTLKKKKTVVMDIEKMKMGFT